MKLKIHKAYTDPKTWDKDKQSWAEGRGYSYKEYTDKGFGFFELSFPLYEKPETPIHPITGTNESLLSLYSTMKSQYPDLETWEEVERELKKPGLKKQIEHVEAGGEYKDLTKEDLETFFEEKSLEPKQDLDPVGDKEWRDKTIAFIAELHKSFPVPEDQLKAAQLVNMYMQFGVTEEAKERIDNIIKYYEIKAAKPKRR